MTGVQDIAYGHHVNENAYRYANQTDGPRQVFRAGLLPGVL